MPLVSGRVVDREGRPVAGARVFFSSGPAAWQDIALVTGDDGSYTMAAPSEGNYEITTIADELGTAKAAIDVRHNGVSDVELRLGD